MGTVGTTNRVLNYSGTIIVEGCRIIIIGNTIIVLIDGCKDLDDKITNCVPNNSWVVAGITTSIAAGTSFVVASTTTTKDIIVIFAYHFSSSILINVLIQTLGTNI